MDMRLSDEQALIRSTFERFFAEQCPPEQVRLLEMGNGHDPVIWSALAELGALGMRIPECYGGLGSTYTDTMLLCETLGGALYPSPFLWTCIAAPLLIAQLASPLVIAEWLPRIATGQAILALAAPDDVLRATSGGALHAIAHGGGYRLSGRYDFVEYAQQADALLIVARVADTLGLFLLPRDRQGMTITRRHEISGGQFYRVACDMVYADMGECLGHDVEGDLRQIVDITRVALAARMIGAAQRVFDLTARYLRERSQFGQALLRFQALHFRLASLLTRIDAARLLVYRAAWAIDHAPSYDYIALCAAAQASDVYREMAAEAIQLHGGFGFTAEASPQLFYRRAAVDAMLLGTATALHERIAAILAL